MMTEKSHISHSSPGAIFSKLFDFTLRHQTLVLLLLFLVTVISLSGLQRLEIDTGFQSLIPEYDKGKQVYKRVSSEFGSDNKNLVYVSDGSLWTTEKLGAFKKLHHDLEKLDFVKRVESIVNLRSVRGNQSSVKTIELMPEVPDTAQQIEEIKTQALYNPLIRGQFVADQGNAMTLLVTFRDNDEDHEQDYSAELDKVLQNYRNVFGYLFQLGSSRINAELKSSLFDDLVLLGPLSILILIVTLLVFVRSFSTALVPLITSGLSLLWALGFMGWFNIPINILTAMLPSLIIVIGSTEDTHLMVSYFHGLENKAEHRRQFAVHFMLKTVGVPMLLTILTTSLGFASNIFSSIGLIQHFAIASTVAIISNGIITLLLVPLLLRNMGPKTSIFSNNKKKLSGVPGFVYRLFDAGNKHYSKSILITTTALCVFFAWQAANLFVTNDPLSYFRADRQLIKDVHALHRDLSGMKTFFITLESDQDKAFQFPDNINRLVKIQEFLEKQGIFDRSISLADHLSLINQEFHAGNRNAWNVPRSREQVAQFLLFFHRHDLESYVSHDYQRANIVVRHNVTDSRTLNKHIAELEEVVTRIAGVDMRAFVTGENLMINRAAESLMTAQVKSLGVLLLVIFLLMSAMFTSFKGGFIALIPSMIPIILMFGVMGLLGISLNPGTAMVAVIAIGIAVDGTIHLFSRYNDLCRKTSDNEQAVQETVRHEAMPIVATSLSLAVGFGVLLFSNFTVVAQFGAMSAMTMLFAVYANLLITPIIMSRVRLVGLYEILVMRMQKDLLKKSPLFIGMSSYQIRKAILISEYQNYYDHDLIIREGAVERSMYLLLAGKVAVERHGHHITDLKVGDVFGEIGFVKETLRTADVKAIGNVQVLRFDFERLQKDLKYFPNIVANLNFNISCILGERLAEVIERSED
jgi:predicted RND superfamily exporter protein